MNARSLVPALALLLVTVPACHRTPPATSEEILPVSGIEAPATASAGERFVVQVRGELPDAAWRFQRLAIATHDTTVVLTPMGSRDPKAMAAQVLTPYVATTRIRKRTPGTMTLVAHGKGGDVKREVRILPR